MRHNNAIIFNNSKGLILCLFLLFLMFFSISSTSYFYAFSQDKQEQGKSFEVKRDITQEEKETAEAAPGEGFVEDDFRPRVEEESYGWLMLKTLLVLGLLAAGFYMFFRFIQQKSGIQLSGQNVVQVLSVVSLGPGKTLHVVDMAGKVFLLGVSENNINLLTEIKDKDEIDRIRLLSSRSAPVAGKGFQEFLTEQVGKAVSLINQKREGKGKVYKMEEVFGEDLDVSYLNSQKNRLKKMNRSNED
ncbi:MAG: flagellar biosynthetic protein FliO [Spirochaetota bacterium]